MRLLECGRIRAMAPLIETKYFPRYISSPLASAGGRHLSSLSINVQEYKVDRLEKMHTWFPDRHFICIGDSTQKDPESYGDIARRHPGWIKAIYIRRVPDENEVQGALNPNRNSNKRFEAAFKGLDPKMWLVFDEADEVRRNVQLLVR